MRHLIPLILAVLLASGACSGPKVKRAHDPKSPFHRYDLAMDELVSGDYTQAAAMFESLSSGTLNPVLSQLATLRLGDSLFFQGRFAEAAEVYRQFLDQYSRSPDWPHAAYMRGLCFLRKMPEDLWVLPPAEAREMSDVDNAYSSFVQLIESAPDTFYAMRARFLLARTVERRCRHHLYVADWYRKQNHPLGIVQRLEQALAEEESERAKRRVPQAFRCASEPGNLGLLARAYYETGNATGLAHTIERLTKANAGTEQVARWQRALDKLSPQTKSAPEAK